MTLRIVRLADCPETIPALAEAFGKEWPDWYGVHGDAVADLRERAQRNSLPLGLVALEDGHAIGSLAISRHAPPSHSQLEPWIVGFWVAPLLRKRGVGTALVVAACEEARAQGFVRLHASAAKAARFFANRGWSKIGRGTSQGGEAVEIFGRTLG